MLTKITGVLLAVVIIILLVTIPVWLLWNAVMPDLFQVPHITFLQALQLTALTRCLIGSNSNSSK